MSEKDDSLYSFTFGYDSNLGFKSGTDSLQSRLKEAEEKLEDYKQEVKANLQAQVIVNLEREKELEELRGIADNLATTTVFLSKQLVWAIPIAVADYEAFKNKGKEK